MHRPTVGLIAILLLGSWVAIHGLGRATGETAALAASCLRIGLVMAALWLALPQMRRMQTWTVGAIVVGAIVVALRPRLILVVLAALLLLALLRPRRRADHRVERGVRARGRRRG